MQQVIEVLQKDRIHESYISIYCSLSLSWLLMAWRLKEYIAAVLQFLQNISAMRFNSLFPGGCEFHFRCVIFKCIVGITSCVHVFPVLSPLGEWHGTLLMISQHIGSCNGLVPPGNEPLPEPKLTQIYVTIWWRVIALWALDIILAWLVSRVNKITLVTQWHPCYPFLFIIHLGDPWESLPWMEWDVRIWGA